MKFVWNEKKAKSNKAKHGVSFDEAKTVFSDGFARLKHDPDHSFSEERFVLLGFSSFLRLLTVVHAEVEDDMIRLISARKATRKEAAQYRRFRR